MKCDRCDSEQRSLRSAQGIDGQLCDQCVSMLPADQRDLYSSMVMEYNHRDWLEGTGEFSEEATREAMQRAFARAGAAASRAQEEAFLEIVSRGRPHPTTTEESSSALDGLRVGLGPSPSFQVAPIDNGPPASESTGRVSEWLLSYLPTMPSSDADPAIADPDTYNRGEGRMVYGDPIGAGSRNIATPTDCIGLVGAEHEDSIQPFVLSAVRDAPVLLLDAWEYSGDSIHPIGPPPPPPRADRPKPCPMCGESPITNYQGDDFDHRDQGHCVECMTCDLRVGPFDHPDTATEFWNDRPHMNALVKHLRAKHKAAIGRKDARILELEQRLEREGRLRREAEERARSRI